MIRRWGILAVAAIAAATLAGRPAGLGLTVVACAVFALAARPRNAWSAVWWLLAAALAAVATVRAAGWVVWPSLIASLALGSLAAAGGSSWRQVAARLVPRATLRPFAALVPARGSGLRHPLTGAAIGLLLLAVFLPLFASADAAFADLLGELVPDDAVDQPVGRLAIWVAVAAAGGALLMATPARPANPGRARLERVEWALPLIALVAVFATFVGFQVPVIAGGHDYVQRNPDVTYAEVARAGFAQLLVAASLTLAVIAAAARWAPDDKLKRALLAALCVLTLAILASALVRLGLYMDAYGFTRLRLSAHAVILWLGAVFAIILLAGVARRGAWLPRATVALSAVALLAFAGSNPDHRIADRNLDRSERTGLELDVDALVGLSADAVPALQAHQVGCLSGEVRDELAEPDGLAGFNLARSRARELLRQRAPCV